MALAQFYLIILLSEEFCEMQYTFNNSEQSLFYDLSFHFLYLLIILLQEKGIKMPIKIGITGGIGSGKTAVAKLFEESGYAVFYADSIAKQLLAEDDKIKFKIITAFGKKSYVKGLPDRGYIAKSVFNNPEKLAVINSIIHPPTIRKIKKLCEAELIRNDMVFAEAALIYEANMQDIFDYVLLVTADEESRINRIVKRDNSDKNEIKRRMANQIPEEKKISRADFVIHNDGTLQDLESKANLFLSVFKSLAK